MLKREFGYIEKGVGFVASEEKQTHDRHYSNANKYILQVETGIEYAEAIDIMPCPFTYKETDKEIEIIEENLNEKQGL